MPDLKIWMNGDLVSQSEATLPVNSAAVFYATNVFEGLRAYWNESDEELYCFRLEEHFTRFRESMKMMRFTIPYSDADLFNAVRAVLAGNEVREDVHMHMVAYVLGNGLDATGPTGLYINPRRRPRVEEEGGLSCCVSSWVRTSDNAIPIRLKSGSNYQNGRLATLQAKADGYDQPIFLNKDGHVAEGTGATFFMVRKGRLVTPPITADILESITRTTLIDPVCPELFGMSVVEREIDRTELYVAEEAFFCGSGYEITPILSIDRFALGDGKVGPITRRLSNAYLDIVRGVDKRFAEWRTPTYRTVKVSESAVSRGRVDLTPNLLFEAERA
jgi:branched-chain amino acid aminotransferase